MLLESLHPYSKVDEGKGVAVVHSSKQYLVMECKVLHIAGDGLPGPGSHPDHLEAGLIQLLCQVVHSHIGRGCNQDLRTPLY